jgi:hypothetical protein
MAEDWDMQEQSWPKRPVTETIHVNCRVLSTIRTDASFCIPWLEAKTRSSNVCFRIWLAIWMWMFFF